MRSSLVQLILAVCVDFFFFKGHRTWFGLISGLPGTPGEQDHLTGVYTLCIFMRTNTDPASLKVNSLHKSVIS